MERILVLRGGALGDFIITLPALALLRAAWPAAQIELAGNATAGQLAVARGLLNVVHSQHEARWSELYGPSSLSPAFARWLTSFDLIVNYWPDPDGDLRSRLPLRAGQMFVSAPATPARAPAAAHYCEPLRTLGLEPREYFFRLAPVASAFSNSAVQALALPTSAASGVTIHPGSGSPRKNWPRANWLQLIGTLPAPISLIMGDAELETPGVDALIAAAQHRTAPAGARQTPATAEPPLTLINRPLEELVQHLSQCRLFLGHDSGISHLAAACGARCVLLFGPTEADCWAPPAPNVRILRRHSDLASLSVDVVRRAVAEALGDQT